MSTPKGAPDRLQVSVHDKWQLREGLYSARTRLLLRIITALLFEVNVLILLIYSFKYKISYFYLIDSLVSFKRF